MTGFFWDMIMARVAVLQMTSTADIKQNLSVLESYCEKAQATGVQLIVLPENMAFMGMNPTDKLHIAETLGQGIIQEALSQLAGRYGLWVIAGSIPLKSETQRVKASCIVYDAQGAYVTHYDKIHLFDARVSNDEAHQESLTILPGDRLVVVDTPVGRVGLSICYDLRFPELYRQLVLQGADIFTIPSAFTQVTGEAHWEALIRARAIENLCYVLAPNQGGVHVNGRHTYGHSIIVDPWGTILGQQEDGPGLVVADIDLQRLRQVRSQFPTNDHHVL